MAKRSLKALSLIMVCGMLLTGCGGSTTASTTTAAADSSAAAAETAASTDSGTHFIGLAMHNQTETWAIQYAKTFQEEADAAGVKIAITDANATPATQVSQIEDLIAQGIDTLVVLPADYTALGNALKEAKDKGIKIVNADSKVVDQDQSLVDCFVTADAYKAGYIAGQYFAKKLAKDATLGELNYSQLSVIADRFTGLQAALKDEGRSDVKLVEKDCTDLSAIATYTEDMLMANPEIAGFLCLNDNTALTCYGTCKQMNHADAMVIGFDGSPAGKQSIAAGEMTATMVYSPVSLAKKSFEEALALSKGETVDKEVKVDMFMIDKDNLSDYSVDDWN